MAATPEGEVVQALIRECNKRGWEQRKITYEGRVGAPDRMVLAPSTLFFVECKAPGQVPTLKVVQNRHDTQVKMTF